MEKEIIYYDFNVIVDFSDTPEKLAKDNFIVVYSPAHIEEIAVSEKSHNASKELVNKDLNALSQVTNNKELLPNHRSISGIVYLDGVYLHEEHPTDCYARVVADYGDKNIPLEQDHKQYISILDKIRNENSVNTREINNIKESEILIKILGQNHNYFKCFTTIKTDYSLLEECIEILANELEKYGYFSEHPKKARSRLHDVTHIIYATASSYFVSNDTKLRKKALAIYKYIGVKTRVYSYNEFKKSNHT